MDKRVQQLFGGLYVGNGSPSTDTYAVANGHDSNGQTGQLGQIGILTCQGSPGGTTHEMRNLY